MPAFPFRFAPAADRHLTLARRREQRRRPPRRRPTTPPQIASSNLDAPLFYQLLLGEIELRSGDTGTAYQLLLDAAKRAKDEALFRRVTDIALQARAGDQALGAVQAWRQALPGFARSPALPSAAAGRAQPRRPRPTSRSSPVLHQTPRPSLPA